MKSANICQSYIIIDPQKSRFHNMWKYILWCALLIQLAYVPYNTMYLNILDVHDLQNVLD